MIKAVNGIQEVNLVRIAENLAMGERGIKANSRVFSLRKSEGFRNFYQKKTENKTLILIAEKIEKGKRLVKSFLFNSDGSAMEKTFEENDLGILNCLRRDMEVVYRNPSGNIIAKKHMQKNVAKTVDETNNGLVSLYVNKTDAEGKSEAFGLVKKMLKHILPDGTEQVKIINEDEFNTLQKSLLGNFNRKF